LEAAKNSNVVDRLGETSGGVSGKLQVDGNVVAREEVRLMVPDSTSGIMGDQALKEENVSLATKILRNNKIYNLGSNNMG
jgi:hypothetical protein